MGIFTLLISRKDWSNTCVRLGNERPPNFYFYIPNARETQTKTCVGRSYHYITGQQHSPGLAKD